MLPTPGTGTQCGTCSLMAKQTLPSVPRHTCTGPGGGAAEAADPCSAEMLRSG